MKATYGGISDRHPVRGKCSLLVYPVCLRRYFYEMTSHREVLNVHGFKFENSLVTAFDVEYIYGFVTLGGL